MGKKPNDDNLDSEIHEQFARLTQPDEYFALFDLLEQYKWSPAIEKKIEQMIMDGFFQGDVIPILSREVTQLDHALGLIYTSDKWARQYQILKKFHSGHLTGLPSKAFSVVLKIRRAIRKEKRHISDQEFKALQKIRDDLSKSAKPKTELEWICYNLSKVITKFMHSRAHSDDGSAPLFSMSDRKDLMQEVLLRLLRRGDYNHTLPRAAKVEYLEKILDTLIKDGRRASLPGGVEISSEHSRNIFLTKAEQHQSESNTMRAKRRKSA